jgi:hypothetical protein
MQGELLVEKVPNRFFEPINCWLVGDRLGQPSVVLNPLVKFLAFLTHGKVPHSRVEAPAYVDGCAGGLFQIGIRIPLDSLLAVRSSSRPQPIGTVQHGLA